MIRCGIVTLGVFLVESLSVSAWDLQLSASVAEIQADMK